MQIVPYAEWSHRPRGATTTSHPIGTTHGVTLHWEGPHMGAFTHDRCADKIRSIQAYHRDTHKWADIAYNLLVCPHGWIYEGRGPGVTSAANGDTSSNAGWYAVCYLGGEGDGFTDDGKQGMKDAVAYLRRHGAGPNVNGHRDHKSTACPGDAIYRWLNTTNFNESTSATQEDDMSAAEFWNHKDPKGEPMWLIVRRGRDRAAAAAEAVGELAQLIKSIPGTGPDTARLADEIVAKIGAALTDKE